MPRVIAVDKARKSPGTCGKCGKEIDKGTSYIWWKFRYGGKRIRCKNCPRPRQSELTNSDKLSRCYAAGEGIEDAIDSFRKNYDVEDLRQAMEDAAAEIMEVAEEYRDSASNVESGMNGNRMPICDELEEKADNLEGKASDLESAASELEEFDEDQVKEDAESELEDVKADEREEKLKEIVQEKKDEWADEQIEKAEEFTDISPEG